MRIRSTKYCAVGTRLPTKYKYWLEFGQSTLTIITISMFTAFSIAAIITAHLDGNASRIAFFNNYYLVDEILGWMFLVQFLLLSSLTIFLVVEMKKYTKRIN